MAFEGVHVVKKIFRHSILYLWLPYLQGWVHLDPSRDSAPFPDDLDCHECLWSGGFSGLRKIKVAPLLSLIHLLILQKIGASPTPPSSGTSSRHLKDLHPRPHQAPRPWPWQAPPHASPQRAPHSALRRASCEGPPPAPPWSSSPSLAKVRTAGTLLNEMLHRRISFFLSSCFDIHLQ
jgi:hypothetical protein